MELNHIYRLRVFAKVAETGSFSRAAEALLVTQPAVSRKVRELEHLVGAPLFDRLGHRVALTERGFAVLRYARDIIARVEQLETEIPALGAQVAGDLHIAANTVWEYLLPSAITEFTRAYPKVLTSMTVTSIPSVVDLIVENRVHLGFVPGAPLAAAIEAIPIAEDEVLVLAAPGHELGQGQIVSAADLAYPLPFVHRLGGKGVDPSPSERYLIRLGLSTVAVMDLDSIEALKRAVRLGAGLGMAPRCTVKDDLARGELVQVRLEAPPPRWTLHAIRNRLRPMTPVQQAFLAQVRTSVGSATES